MSDTDASEQGAQGEPESSDGSFKPITTQEDFDRALGARLHQERSKFLDYDDLKAKAAELDKLKEGQKSELEKEQDARAAAEREREHLKVELQDARLEREVLTSAGKKGIVDPDAAVRLLDRSKITYDQDGRPNNVDALLDELAAAKPYLVANRTSPNGAGDGGPRGRSDAGADMNQILRRATGRA